MNGVLLGPGPLGKAVTKPYDNITLWETGDYCTHEGKIYKFIGEDLVAGESWTPAHWAEIKLTDEIINLAEQIAALDPEQGVSLYTDVSFTINTNQWAESNGTYSYNFANSLIKQNSGIQVFYDESFRTALDGDIKVNQAVGYVTFITNKAPLGALSGTLRIIDSVAGVVPTSKGGTGAVTIKGARQNLNVSIRPIPINFGTVSSLPQTVYDDDITSDMIPSKWVYGNPLACINGLKCTTANGSVTISLPTGGSFSGETTVYLELVNPRATADGDSGQEQEQSASDYVQIGAQTLTSTQKAQVRTNIDAVSNDDLEAVSDQITNVESYKIGDSIPLPGLIHGIASSTSQIVFYVYTYKTLPDNCRFTADFGIGTMKKISDAVGVTIPASPSWSISKGHSNILRLSITNLTDAVRYYEYFMTVDTSTNARVNIVAASS